MHLSCSVFEIKNITSRLFLFQKPGNQTCELGCPDKFLVAHECFIVLCVRLFAKVWVRGLHFQNGFFDLHHLHVHVSDITI